MPEASSRSVLARRARRLTRMLVGSSTWAAMPSAVSRRCSQNPSRPASKQQATRTGVPSLAAARARSAAASASSAAVSPPSIRCRLGFSTPGRRAATSQAERLSSIARWMVGYWTSVWVTGGSLAWGGHPSQSVMPTLIASGTRPRPACRGHARAALPPPARRSLFERLLRRLVGLRVPGPDRHAGEAEPAQDLADRALAQPDREAGLDQRLEVDPAPPHHAVPVRVRPPLHGGHQLGLLLGRETRLAPRPGPVAQAGEALRVVAVHPVAQGLPVHAGRPRRFLARGPLQHQRQGEHPPRRPRVPAPRHLAPQLAGARLAPGDRDRHPRPPVSASNHRSTAAGATRLRARQHVRNSGRWYDSAKPAGAVVASWAARG